MKKHLSLLAVAGLLFVQCSQPDPAEVPDPTLPTVSYTHLTLPTT